MQREGFTVKSREFEKARLEIPVLEYLLKGQAASERCAQSALAAARRKQKNQKNSAWAPVQAGPL
jgi:hypothetical protein